MSESGNFESGGVGYAGGENSGIGFCPPKAARPQEEYLVAFGCKNVPMMVGKNETARASVFFRPRCKMWSCEACARVNSDLWIMRATMGGQELLNAGEELALVTVTAHERHNIRQAVGALPHQWNKLRCRWQRETSKPKYLLVPEVGEYGHFHLHLITTGKMGTRWWKDNARPSGFGYIADESERQLSASKTGFYIGKYLAKQLHNNQWKKGFHRVRTSQSWPKLCPLPRNTEWSFHTLGRGESVYDSMDLLSRSGYSIRMADSRSAWSLIETGDVTGTIIPPFLMELIDTHGR